LGSGKSFSLFAVGVKIELYIRIRKEGNLRDNDLLIFNVCFRGELFD